jgi:hypothetical protein
MAIVTRQLLVNKILLPVDMLNVIKDFAFIDMVTQTSKYNKDIVNNVIKNAWVSSFRDITEDEIEDENEETMVAEVEEVEEPYLGDIWYDPENDPWANLVDANLVDGDFAWAEDEDQLFWDQDEDNELIWAFCADENEAQFQAVFCQNCGNYITEHLQIPYSDKINCKCIVL